MNAVSKRPDHESPDYRYDQWAGNPNGYSQRPMRCVAPVMHPPGFHSLQCSRQNGHGYHGLYCKQHAKRYP